MPSDVVAVPAIAHAGESARPEMQGTLTVDGLAEARGDVSVKAGGVEYVEPPAPRDPKFCASNRADGEPCKAFATRTGRCVGHSRALHEE